MSYSSDEALRQFLTQRLPQETPASYAVESTLLGFPPLKCYQFLSLPQPNLQTVVTSGMSPLDAVHIREVVVTVRSLAADWAVGLLTLLEPLRSQTTLQFGDYICGEYQLSSVTKMVGLGFYAPAAFERCWSKFQTPAGHVQLVGGYPLYREECPVVDEIGFKEFGQLHSQVDWLDPQRINLEHHLQTLRGQQRRVVLYHHTEAWEIVARVPMLSDYSQLQRLAWQVMKDQQPNRKLHPKNFGVESLLENDDSELPEISASPAGKGWNYRASKP